MKRNIKVYPTPIAAYGWTKLEDCFCGGIYKIKFVHADYPGFILEWWVDHYRIKMTRNRSSYSGQVQLKNADVYLMNFSADQDAKKAEAEKAAAPVSVPVVETEKVEAAETKATQFPKDKIKDNEVTKSANKAIQNSTPRKSKKKKATK